MSSEVYSYLYEKILSEGALDVYTESIFMKKNRPAIKISVLCEVEDLEKFVDILILETSTFGVRYTKYNRAKIDREFREISTPYGNLTVKLGYYKGSLIKVSPEYEQCKQMSKDNKVPIITIFNNINFFIQQEFKPNLLT